MINSILIKRLIYFFWEENIKVKLTITLVLTCIFGSVIYYLLYSFVELNSSGWCKKNICIEFISYTDFLTICLAILSLYFVVTSLEEWKGQYKFEKSLKTFEKIQELGWGLEKLIGNTYVLINESRRYGHSHAYRDYDEKLKEEKLNIKIFYLRSDIFEEKNNYRQDDFEEIISVIESIESGLTGELRDLHWNDSSAQNKKTEDAEIIFNEYREKLNILKIRLDKLKKKLQLK